MTFSKPPVRPSPRSNPASRAPRPASSRWPALKRATCPWCRPKPANSRSPPIRKAGFLSAAARKRAEPWELLAVLALLGSLSRGGSRANRRQIQAWYAALAPYGSRIEGTPTAEVRILTRQDSLHIRVTGIDDQEEDLVAVVFPEPWAFSGVDILATSFRPFVGGRETKIGDRRFEVTFRLLGPSRLVSSLLDAETRRLMTSLE